jgi:hypothetical protein
MSSFDAEMGVSFRVMIALHRYSLRYVSNSYQKAPAYADSFQNPVGEMDNIYWNQTDSLSAVEQLH